ncbi:hypothetical protein [Thioclava sp. DLFJ5-1]|uniref:hypothetical protein n=1 Tax=Thioclava sp. DLFJ5-1 TaxID=1915314 RepID=UPI00117BF51C|nr:hypothetical protein [Thioclava sp. DLFJ5-1]
MSKKGSYLGGSTIVRWGSSWFSRPETGVDPETGETRAERIRRLSAEAVRRREQKEQKSKKSAPLNISKKRALSNEKRRLKRVAKNHAKLSEQKENAPREERESDVQQRQRMSKVIVEVKPKPKIISPKG